MKIKELRKQRKALPVAERLNALEALVKDLYGIYEAREERLDVMGRRIRDLERRVAVMGTWVDGTDLITSERFCALTERVAEIEERLNTLETFADNTAALLERRTKRHNALVERVGKLEQGQRLEWIQRGRAAGYNISVAEEDKDE